MSISRRWTVGEPRYDAMAMKRRIVRCALIPFAVLALVASLSAPLAAQQDDPGAPRTAPPLTILQLNDVYSTVPIDGEGGLARVATLKQRLVNDGRRPFMMLAG